LEKNGRGGKERKGKETEPDQKSKGKGKIFNIIERYFLITKARHKTLSDLSSQEWCRFGNSTLFHGPISYLFGCNVPVGIYSHVLA
jgi:hypothetical protein